MPVARTRWWEDDPDWVEEPFYVRDRIEGSWDIPNFIDPDPEYDTLRVEIGREHVRKLAIVYKVDWRALGFCERLAVPRDEADCAHLFVDTILGQLAGFAVEPTPLVVEAAEWLHAHAPVAPHISLCKGTASARKYSAMV